MSLSWTLLDPSSSAEFSDLLYANDELMDALSHALRDEGFFVAQIGAGDDMDDPPESLSSDPLVEAFLHGLHRAGFESVMECDKTHGHLLDNWSFLVAMKNIEDRANWFMTESEFQLEMHQRSMRTKDGESPFRFFDGATMMQHKLPSRLVEESWCRGP